MTPSKSAVVVPDKKGSHDDNKFSQMMLKQSSEERNTQKIIINSNNIDSDSDLSSTSPERRDQIGSLRVTTKGFHGAAGGDLYEQADECQKG